MKDTADQEGGEEQLPMSVNENFYETPTVLCEHSQHNTRGGNGHEDEVVLCGSGGLLRSPILLALLFLGCTTQVSKNDTH